MNDINSLSRLSIAQFMENLKRKSGFIHFTGTRFKNTGKEVGIFGAEGILQIQSFNAGIYKNGSSQCEKLELQAG